MANYQVEDEAKMVFDLRQVYVEILRGILIRIQLFRETNDYANYYKALNDLRIEIMKNLLAKERLELAKAREKTLKILEEHETVLTGTNRDGLERFHVEEALAEYEMLLYDYMQKHSMYGSGWDDSGL